MSGCVLVLGATSPLGRALALGLARRGHRLVLASRDVDELLRLASDVRIRTGQDAAFLRFDADQPEAEACLAEAERMGGSLAGIVSVAGYLGETPATLDPLESRRILQRNFTGLAEVIGAAAARLEAAGAGFVVGIGSVAGDRGRQSNFVYGAAKGGFERYLQGLRNRLARKGVHVMTVKPGFLDTGMTYGKPGIFLAAAPEAAAEAILRALDRRRNVIYVPGFWRFIMAIIRAIPEGVFKKMKL